MSLEADARTAPSRRRPGSKKKSADADSALSDRDYAFIRELIYEETRINLGERKRELVAARLGKRLRALGCPSLSAYCRRLQDDPENGEIYHLIDAISTNHTFFFRARAHFDFLNAAILPAFVRGEWGTGHPLRIWSCACSTGEEPYSIAIEVAEGLRSCPELQWQLVCSDISTKALNFAAKGVYSEGQLGQVSAMLRKKYFQRGREAMRGYARIHPNLRRQIDFYRLNLFSAAYPWSRKFHAIFCRNVMIYFDRPTQEDLVGRLARHLLPGGYLIIGHAESLAGVKHAYQAIKPSVYRLG